MFRVYASVVLSVCARSALPSGCTLLPCAVACRLRDCFCSQQPITHSLPCPPPRPPFPPRRRTATLDSMQASTPRGAAPTAQSVQKATAPRSCTCAFTTRYLRMPALSRPSGGPVRRGGGWRMRGRACMYCIA